MSLLIKCYKEKIAILFMMFNSYRIQTCSVCEVFIINNFYNCFCVLYWK